MTKPKQILELFKKAESAIKTCEYVSLQLNFPAINELRYAGRHLAEAVSANNESYIEEHLRKAESHCFRAIFDAYDVATLHLIDKVNSIVTQNPVLINKDKSSPEEISNLLAQFNKARSILLDARTNSDISPKDKVEQYEHAFNGLDEAYRRLNIVQPILLDKASKDTLKHLTMVRRWAAIVVGTVSFIAALISILMGV